MIHTFYFSPSGTTKKTVEILSKALSKDTAYHDITVKPETFVATQENDLVVIAGPVYAGRIPPLAGERLSGVKGKGQKAVVVVVYGNRDYDDALLELCDIARRQGFDVMAAGAFIGEHCIFPKVAAGRPDAEDRIKIHEFAEAVKRALESSESLDLCKVKGNRPYKKIAGVPLHPRVDKALCNTCGTCARECPTGAIPPDNTKTTDGSKCITCCRCIQVCPQDARSLGGLLYKIAGWKFVRDYSRRRSAEWFIRE